MLLRRVGAVLALAVLAACTDAAPLVPPSDDPAGTLASASPSATAPSAPSNLVPTLLSDTSLQVTWTAGTDSTTHFEVHRRILNADSTWGDWHLASWQAPFSRVHYDTWIYSGSTVRFRIRACNDTACSDWEWSAAIWMAPPAVPANLAGTPLSATRLRVTWTEGAGNEDGFRLHRQHQDNGAWTPLQPLAAPERNATAFTDTGLVAGVTYRYHIDACNAAGCSAGVLSPDVVIPSPPAAPTGTAAAATSATSAQVTWTDASTDETSFTIARRLRNLDGTLGPWTVAGFVTAGSTAYPDGELLPGRTYKYMVRACVGVVCSEWSPAARVTLPAG
ncbi:MAG TPA: fibronectin type III domain-containing protein [Longimicrobium sp.]|nr:fibronectin type III domain-containing protein [Longimicrobium sp.]